MTTQKILSTITLLCMALAPLQAARASQQGPLLASISPSTDELPARLPGEEAPHDVLVRHRIAIGFNESPQLQASLRAKLAATGRYLMHDEQQIPSAPTGMFVGGLVQGMQPENGDHGWVSCHARYFVAGQPGFAALQIETVAASVPIMQVQIFRGRPEVLELAQESCAAQLAEQIVENLSKLR